ncbi:OsmC family protein [Clavibacter tessellarius]|uniref:OsmC family protein n=1 Tax=Clavibacter tessellarius TaxID=31965 RepID=UPI00324831FB
MPQHPTGSVLEFDLRGSGSGVLQEISIAGSPHTVRAEGHPAFGGTDSAPSPLDLVLSAYVSCNQVTATIVALGQGITLGAFEGRVQAEPRQLRARLRRRGRRHLPAPDPHGRPRDRGSTTPPSTRSSPRSPAAAR